MWHYEYSLVADVTPAAVWRLYSDPSTWADWDHGLESMDLDGSFTEGATGRLTPHGRDSIPFELTGVTEQVCFTDETRLDDLVLRFIHRLDPVDAHHTRITHRVEILGPAADTAGPRIGPAISADIPNTVATLAQRAARPKETGS